MARTRSCRQLYWAFSVLALASSSLEAQPSACAPGCSRHGTCYEPLGRCDCPFGRTGPTCVLIRECAAPGTDCFTPCSSAKLSIQSCECARKCFPLKSERGMPTCFEPTQRALDALPLVSEVSRGAPAPNTCNFSHAKLMAQIRPESSDCAVALTAPSPRCPSACRGGYCMDLQAFDDRVPGGPANCGPRWALPHKNRGTTLLCPCLAAPDALANVDKRVMALRSTAGGPAADSACPGLAAARKQPTLKPFCFSGCSLHGTCVHDGFCRCERGFFGLDCALTTRAHLASQPGAPPVPRGARPADVVLWWRPEGDAAAPRPRIYVYNLPPEHVGHTMAADAWPHEYRRCGPPGIGRAVAGHARARDRSAGMRDGCEGGTSIHVSACPPASACPRSHLLRQALPVHPRRPLPQRAQPRGRRGPGGLFLRPRRRRARLGRARGQPL